MDGRQSFLLNDIKQHIRQGGNVSHILNVKVSRQPSSEVGTRIRQEIFRRINETPITIMLSNIPITITWRSSARKSSAYYHSDVGGIFGDVAVKGHTKLLLSRILAQIDGQFNHIFSNNQTGLVFMVSRPLVREVVILDESENEDDEKLDETEEQN
jgi:hypothetical protein